jgi:DNA-binding beta-propeller fold protein YncE
MESLRGKGLKTLAIVMSLTLLVVAGYFIFTPAKLTAESQKPLYKGTVYSATRGGHLVFTTITIDPNREMISGSVAGRMPIPNNEQADAIEMSPDHKYIYYPTWDQSMLYVIDITKKTDPKVVAEKKIFDKPTKHCGSHWGPDGKLYFSSMALGDIHKFDVSNPLDPKLMDRLYKTTYLCGVQVLDNGKYVWTSDMKDHKIYVYEAATGKRIKEIETGRKEFLHRARLSPDGKLLYQASTGAVAGQPADGRFYIVDTKAMKVKDTVVFGEDYDVHDVATTPDGKYAIAAARRVPPKEYKDSEYIVVNLQTKKVLGSISMCKSCHAGMGVDPEAKSGREVFICGIQIAWEK